MKSLIYMGVHTPCEEDTYLCPHCHGEVYHAIISTKVDNPEYHWECNTCYNEFNQYELFVKIGEPVCK